MTEDSTIQAAPTDSAARSALFFRRLRHADSPVFLR